MGHALKGHTNMAHTNMALMAHTAPYCSLPLSTRPDIYNANVQLKK
jgi:hypothetical protein